MRKRLLTLAIMTSATLVVTGCTTDGGQKSIKQNGSETLSQPSNSASNLPLVTGAAGAAPTIAAPQGSAPTSLQISDVIVGSGATASASSTLTVHYTLMAWSTGKVVESSWTSGSPATFALSQVIPGWQQGMPGMKVGGRRLLVIPPDLGYGASGAGPIGPNETLIFVVDLVAVI